MIETSSAVPRKSSAIFGKFRKMFGNVRLALGTILENLRKSSAIKWSEIFGYRQKLRYQYVYIIKTDYTLALRYEFCVLVARTILSLPLEHKIHFFSPPCSILYILTPLELRH